jgi:hypothetical protein
MGGKVKQDAQTEQERKISERHTDAIQVNRIAASFDLLPCSFYQPIPLSSSLPTRILRGWREKSCLLLFIFDRF